MHLNSITNLQFDFINAEGQSIKTNIFKNVSGDFSTPINVPGLASGVYMLRITDGKKAYYEKVLITR